jgi:SAM-dependent methyltransferase
MAIQTMDIPSENRRRIRAVGRSTPYASLMDSPAEDDSYVEDDYKAYVGPADRYDSMGASQMALLQALGLRSRHHLLDVGCGSLRAGRLLIPYLNSGCYTGLEPNKWLIEAAIDEQLGREIVTMKAPVFVHNDSFNVSGLGKFDFVVAQSIASHTGPAMTQGLLSAVKQALAPSGYAVMTFVHTTNKDSVKEGWVYPGWRTYRRKTVARWLGNAGLKGKPIAWSHPGKQTWWLIVHADARLPSTSFLVQLRGITLPRPESWRPKSQARRKVRGIKRSIFG